MYFGGSKCSITSTKLQILVATFCFCLFLFRYFLNAFFQVQMPHALSTTASHPKVGVFNLDIALQRASPVCEAGQCTNVSLMHANIIKLLGFVALDYIDHIYGQVMAGVHYLQSTDLYRGYLRLRMVVQYRYAVMICDVQIVQNTATGINRVCTAIPQQLCASFMSF